MSSLERVIVIGYEVNKRRESGLAAWQPLKKEFADIDITFPGKLKCPDLAMDEADDQNAVLNANGILLENTREPDHFVVQLFRLPALCGATIPHVKMMQIAYNYGQYLACKERGEYRGEVIDYVEKHHWF